MSDSTPGRSVVSIAKNWLKEGIDLVVGIAAFVVLLRGNILVSIILAIVFLVSMLGLCIYRVSARIPPQVKGGKKGPYRFQRSRPWAFAGIGLVGGIILMAIAIGPSRSFVISALAGSSTPPSLPGSPPPPVSLVSLSYIVDEFSPHLVDLRTASTSGIPVSAGQALRLFDLWISAPQDAPLCQVWAEIYANGQIIGTTPSRTLTAGLTRFDVVEISNFIHGTHRTSWSVQQDWRDLQVFFITYRDGQVVGRNVTMIHLDANGTAWLIDPPNLNFVSIVYAINGGLPLVSDLRNTIQGLGAKPGDTLQLLEVWYNANADSDHTVTVEAFLSSGEFDPVTDRATLPHVIQGGIHRLADVSPLSWEIPVGKARLILWLLRIGGGKKSIVMDRLELPLKSEGTPGLVSAAEAVRWPQAQVRYLDFESPADLSGWTGTVTSTLGLSPDKAFTGGHSLAITTTGTQEVYLHWKPPFAPRSIVGQVFWPAQEGVNPGWAQVCVGVGWQCVSMPIEQGRWNTFVVDLSALARETADVDSGEPPDIWIQGQIDGVSKGKPYTFYIDGIQLSPAPRS